MPISVSDYSSDYDYYYTDDFKTLVRSQKELLLRNGGTQGLIDRTQVQIYRYDFYRLLRALKIPPHLWWATAYINNVEDPFKDIMEMTEIRTINASMLESAIARKNTTRG